MNITLVVLCAVAVAFANGANDVSKGIATLVGAGISEYHAAVRWGTIWTAFGALTAGFITQTLVRTFSGKGILLQAPTPESFLLAVSLGAIGWLIIATQTGLPVSTTHSLVGALVGTALVSSGSHGIIWSALLAKIALPLVFSPVISLVLILLITPATRTLTTRLEGNCICITSGEVAVADDGMALYSTSLYVAAGDAANNASCASAAGRLTAIDALHWCSAGATSFFRGLNDAPKIAALGIAAAATAGLPSHSFYLLVAMAMASGSLLAGFRVTETLAKKVVRITPPNGFAANVITSLLVAVATWYSLPVSTTHVSSGSIIGIGVSAQTAVHWKIVAGMATAWFVTLPASAAIAAGCWLLIR